MMWTIPEQCLKKFKYNVSLSIRSVWSSVSNAADRRSSTNTTSLLESFYFQNFICYPGMMLSIRQLEIEKKAILTKIAIYLNKCFVFLIWNSQTSRCQLMKCVITWEVLTPRPRWNSPYHCLRQTSKFHLQVSFSKYTESCEVLHKWILKAVQLKRVPKFAYKRGLVVKLASRLT